jgi:hypothetical protein
MIFRVSLALCYTAAALEAAEPGTREILLTVIGHEPEEALEAEVVFETRCASDGSTQKQSGTTRDGKLKLVFPKDPSGWRIRIRVNQYAVPCVISAWAGDLSWTDEAFRSHRTFPHRGNPLAPDSLNVVVGMVVNADRECIDLSQLEAGKPFPRLLTEDRFMGICWHINVGEGSLAHEPTPSSTMNPTLLQRWAAQVQPTPDRPCADPFGFAPDAGIDSEISGLDWMPWQFSPASTFSHFDRPVLPPPRR